MPRPILPTLEESGPEGFVKFFAFREDEFLTDEIDLIIARIAKAESKTRAEVIREVEPLIQFKEKANGPYKFELWGHLDLLARVHATRDIPITEAVQ